MVELGRGDSGGRAPFCSAVSRMWTQDYWYRGTCSVLSSTSSTSCSRQSRMWGRALRPHLSPLLSKYLMLSSILLSFVSQALVNVYNSSRSARLSVSAAAWRATLAGSRSSADFSKTIDADEIREYAPAERTGRAVVSSRGDTYVRP